MLDEDVFDLLLPNLDHLFLVIGHQDFGDGLCETAQIWVS